MKKTTEPSIYQPDAYVVFDVKSPTKRVVYQSDWCNCQKWRHSFPRPNQYDIRPANGQEV